MKFFKWPMKFPDLAISLPLAVLAAALVVFINEASYHNTVKSIRDMEQAQSTRTALNELLQSMLDAETGQRGYLLTGNNSYLAPYNETLKTVNRQLDQLRVTFAPYPDQLSDFGVLSRHVSRKMAEMELSVKMRDAGQEDAWRFVLTTDVGKEQMEGIRTQADKLADNSLRNMERGQAQVRRTLQLSRIGIAVMALGGLLAFTCIFCKHARCLIQAFANRNP